MSLFKKNIVSQYNIIANNNNTITLHCSKYDSIKAPFDGKLIIEDDVCTLANGNKVVTFGNVKCNMDKIGHVVAGDIIGYPSNKSDKAIFTLSVYVNQVAQNPVTYLQRRDHDNEPKKKNKQEKAKKTKTETPELIVEDIISEVEINKTENA